MAIDAPSTPELLEGLQVDIAGLRRRGEDRHRVQTALPARWLAAILSETDAEVGDAGHVDLEILLPTDGALVATGQLTITFTVPCGRCLEPAPVEETADVTATYVIGTAMPGPTGPKGQDDDEAGLGLSDDDLDTWLYDGSTLHLDALVAEQVKLAYPMRALCSRAEACRGLCSNCGADQNAAPPVAGRCQSCGAEVGPVVGDPPAEGAPSAGIGGEGPLAQALKKLQLPD